MRKLDGLLVTLVAIGGSAAAGLSQALAQSADQAPPPAAAAPNGTGERSVGPGIGMPGIYVTPVPQRQLSPGGTGGSAPAAAPQEQGGGGCQYVPRKLDLIS